MEFKYGELHGKSIDWDKNGKIEREAIFKDGKMISVSWRNPIKLAGTIFNLPLVRSLLIFLTAPSFFH